MAYEKTERQKITAAIQLLTNQLASDQSKIGDWKIIKIYEARMSNQPDPYDFDKLMAARNAVREKINACQRKLETLPPDPVDPNDPFNQEII